MDILAEDKKLSRLTKPEPDDRLGAILKGNNFDDYKSPLFIAWQLNSACNCGDLKKESLNEIWENYKKAWKRSDVIEFARKVIAAPKLLAESNNWRQI